MAEKEITEDLQNLKLEENKDINVLLLGETGVGKSTFINSIANYLHFKTFENACEAKELLVLIPSLITLTAQNSEQITLTVGSDDNEFQEIGAAGTQGVKTYVFPTEEGKTNLRLMDTPGMGDPRGIEQDDINCENILTYLSQLKELHAICFLMKPTTTRKNILFEYCVKQILSRLEKSASNNIIFIFTNTRGTNYSPGDTLPCLRRILDDIKSKPPNVEIPLKDNVFSFDNEAFKYLVAMKKEIKFTEDVQRRVAESWNNSLKECWRLYSYILGDTKHEPLKPHQLLNTISVNEARRVIVNLSKPLADISELIRILERHQNNLKMENQTLDELKSKLYIPVVNLEVIQLTQPTTVKVEGIKKWHYRQRCHDPCYLNNVSKEVVGDLNLRYCAAMKGQRSCRQCTCDFSVHMHVYYLTKTKDERIVDNNVKNNITKKEEAVSESLKLIRSINQRKKELEQEHEVIVQSTAQFAHFLQHFAMSPFNDSYKTYIEYLITREKSLGESADEEVIRHLESLLHRYQEIKLTLEESFQRSQQPGPLALTVSSIMPESIMSLTKKLFELKHNGRKLRELLVSQNMSRKAEYNNRCEYVHSVSSVAPSKMTESKKNIKQADTTYITKIKTFFKNTQSYFMSSLKREDSSSNQNDPNGLNYHNESPSNEYHSGYPQDHNVPPSKQNCRGYSQDHNVPLSNQYYEGYPQESYGLYGQGFYEPPPQGAYGLPYDRTYGLPPHGVYGLPPYGTYGGLPSHGNYRLPPHGSYALPPHRAYGLPPHGSSGAYGPLPPRSSYHASSQGPYPEQNQKPSEGTLKKDSSLSKNYKTKKGANRPPSQGRYGPQSYSEFYGTFGAQFQGAYELLPPRGFYEQSTSRSSYRHGPPQENYPEQNQEPSEDISKKELQSDETFEAYDSSSTLSDDPPQEQSQELLEGSLEKEEFSHSNNSKKKKDRKGKSSLSSKKETSYYKNSRNKKGGKGKKSK